MESKRNIRVFPTKGILDTNDENIYNYIEKMLEKSYRYLNENN